MKRLLYTCFLSTCTLLSGCTSQTVKSDTDTTTPASQDTSIPPAPTPSNTTPQERDWQAITRLEEQAKALVDSSGCATAEACRTAPVGSRGCGGPRYYLVYCPTRTDSTKLHAKLAEVEAAERAYNKKYQIGSTCEMRLPPKVESVNGICRAVDPRWTQ